MNQYYDMNNYYLYRCIILSIRKKNPKYIYKALKLNKNFDKNLLIYANEIIDYFITNNFSKILLN